jgi:hypothetical protein
MLNQEPLRSTSPESFEPLNPAHKVASATARAWGRDNPSGWLVDSLSPDPWNKPVTPIEPSPASYEANYVLVTDAKILGVSTDGETTAYPTIAEALRSPDERLMLSNSDPIAGIDIVYNWHRNTGEQGIDVRFTPKVTKGIIPAHLQRRLGRHINRTVFGLEPEHTVTTPAEIYCIVSAAGDPVQAFASGLPTQHQVQAADLSHVFGVTNLLAFQTESVTLIGENAVAGVKVTIDIEKDVLVFGILIDPTRLGRRINDEQETAAMQCLATQARDIQTLVMRQRGVLEELGDMRFGSIARAVT